MMMTMENFELPSGKTGIACETVAEMEQATRDLARRMRTTAMALGMDPAVFLAEVLEAIADDEHAYIPFIYGPTPVPTSLLFRVPLEAVQAHQAARAEQGVSHVG